ncbi:MAG: DNA mismatch repair endonuclease MutL [Planctomycetaceae bacterium]|nr:DNA mismatch repair endonuclease MutL [Planctomycetaceae bacterium]
MTSTRIIRSLSQSMINKIAAGEVIERPASVIKELMENSIDAEAKRIDVIVEQAGMSLMRVVDDGVGMAEDQLLLAVKPHSTSKINDTDDLFRIRTFGFRGEALASIAEISQLTLKSRAVDQNGGAMITCNGNDRSAPTPCGMPIGTQIDVRNLFFNTPVRRKYMKSTSTEFGHIIDVFVRIAIPHPNIHFTLKHNDKIVHELPADPNVLTRIKLLFGEDIGKGLVYIEGQSTGNVRIEGYVSLPANCRLNSKLQYLFLNGRFIRDRALQHALAESYRGLLVSNRFPIAFLNIIMPPDLFDVNVHPTKLEVRFLDSNRVYSGLLSAVREKFMKTDLSEQVDLDTMKPEIAKQNNFVNEPNDITIDDPQNALARNITETHRYNVANMEFPVSTNNITAANSHKIDLDNNNFAVNNSSNHKTEFARHLPDYSKDDSSNFRYDNLNETKHNSNNNFINNNNNNNSTVSSGHNFVTNNADSSGDYVTHFSPVNERVAYSPTGRVVVQMHNRYLVLETAEGIAIIDQHALHERILYEKLKELMGGIVEGGKLEAQRLLVPVPVDLSPTEYSVVMDNLGLLKNLGLQVEPFGGDTVIISSLPTILSAMPANEILLSLLEPLLNRGLKPEPIALLEEMLHSMACKAAIKAGEKMRADAISKLIAQAESEINSHHCPHGRPSSLTFTCVELDKRFRR